MMMTTSTEVWVAQGLGVVVHGVWDDRPRIELIVLPVIHTLYAVWGTGPEDVWIGGQDQFPSFSGVMDPPYGSVHHWDGCRWTRRGPERSPAVFSLAGSEPLRPWAATRGAALHWEGEAWVVHHEGLSEGETIREVRSTPGGGVFGIVVDARHENVAVHQRVDARWQRRTVPFRAQNLQLAMGRDWVAIAPFFPDTLRGTLSVYREGAWTALPSPGEGWWGLEATADRLGAYVGGRLVFYDHGVWRPEALGAALAARGETRLEGARVASFDSDPLGLEGVRWYLLPSREGGLVGCRMHAGQVDCIGAVEGHFDLTRAP